MRFIPLFSGSSGNSQLLDTGETKLLIDAGVSCSALTGALQRLKISPAQLSGILISHDHIDHTRSAGTLSRKYNLPVYANKGTWDAMPAGIGEIAFRNVRLFRTNQDFYISDVNITPFRTPHDAAEPVGFRFVYKGKKVVSMTDIGCVHEDMLKQAEGADLIYIEANHDVEMLQNGHYPYTLKKRILSDFGHLSNENCGITLAKLYESGVRSAILGHLSHDNNTPLKALETVTNVLHSYGIDDMKITVAERNSITGIFEI